MAAGKRDQTTHEAAIAKIARALPHASTIRVHLGEILNGDTFKGSRRSQEFLKHVVECALAGQWERLKERSLGIDVFGRDASYDTGGDSIVRVTACDVRKRLIQHYSECDGTPACRIEIPAGSYIPEFAGLSELPPPIALGNANGVPPPAAIGLSSVDSRSAGREHFTKRLALLLLVVVGWTLGIISAHLIGRPSTKTDSRYAFYRELLGPIATDSVHETEVALSNPHLLLYVGGSNPAAPTLPSAVNARVPAELEQTLNHHASDAQVGYPFHFLTPADQDYTGMGEAISAFNVSQLMVHIARPLRVTEARFLNWAAVRNVHLILLGAPQKTSWVQESMERSNFSMEQDAILNARPLSGERKVYGRSAVGNVLDDYGLIWMARSPSGSRHLLMAGLTNPGTAGVGDFFCDPDRMRPVYEKLRAASKDRAIPSDWQVLLHIHVRESVPVQVSFVSLRAGAAN